MNGSTVGLPAQAGLLAEFLGRNAILHLEGTLELRLVAKTRAVGDLGNTFPNGLISKCSAASFESLVPDPASKSLISVTKQIMQIAGGNSAATRNAIHHQCAGSQRRVRTLQRRLRGYSPMVYVRTSAQETAEQERKWSIQGQILHVRSTHNAHMRLS